MRYWLQRCGLNWEYPHLERSRANRAEFTETHIWNGIQISAKYYGWTRCSITANLWNVCGGDINARTESTAVGWNCGFRLQQLNIHSLLYPFAESSNRIGSSFGLNRLNVCSSWVPEKMCCRLQRMDKNYQNYDDENISLHLLTTIKVWLESFNFSNAIAMDVDFDITSWANFWDSESSILA